tara:strand:+ start:529 stop:729 length:201 start_codon:yes stop_codon:yes gene_type:complete
MFLEDKEFINELMFIFFENLRGIVTDYAQAQYELNKELCEKIDDLDTELYGIRLKLSELKDLGLKE